MIGLVAITTAGGVGADRLAAAWPAMTRRYPGPAAVALPQAFAECDAVVAFLATGATVRLLAPLLVEGERAGKATDPAVVCVDQAHRYAVALLSGHLGGANQLATDVASVLGAEPVVTTATDAVGFPGLDDLGLPVQGDVAGVGRAMLDGESVQLVLERPWPLPAFPPQVTAITPVSGRLDDVTSCGGEIWVTDRLLATRPGRVVLSPPVLVLGIGASTGADYDDLVALVEETLAAAGLARTAVREIVTIDRRTEEPAICALAKRLRVPLRGFPAAELATHPAPNPSETVRAAVGTPSVAEAAVLAAGAELIIDKRACPASTVAVGRFAPQGRLTIIGIGPGTRDLVTPRAVAKLRASSVVLGLDQYIHRISDVLRPGTRVIASGMGQERERTRTAVNIARTGAAVALVGSGDAGIYAMASPVLEILSTADEEARSAQTGRPQAAPPIDVECVPGVTAALAASSLLGAPLGNDHAYLSLSDLHTPWETIECRLIAVAEGDLTVALYNPRSQGRRDHLKRALGILARHRPPNTPVGVVRNAYRSGQFVTITTLTDLEVETVDMLTVVIVGACDTRVLDGRMVTPRGYRWLA